MSSQELVSFIDTARKGGMSDIKIFLAMQDSPKFSTGIKKANDAGMSNRDLARDLGLNIAPHKPVDINDGKAEVLKKSAKEAGKTKAWESVLLGASDLGAGVIQGATYAADGVNGGINKLLGTKLDTKSYDRFTNQRKDIEQHHNDRRSQNGQGFDGLRMVGQIAATAPMAALGRGYQGAKVLSKVGAEVAAQNAAVGAAIGGSGFAKDANQRYSNTALGAVGGALGGAAGEKIGQGVNKAINVGRNTANKLSTTRTNEILSQIDQKLDDALRQGGSKVTLGQMSDDVANGLRQDALKILKSGSDLSPEAVARKAVLDRLGLKGTQAQLTGDARLWNKQAELSKINGAGDPLNAKLIDDNVQLKSLLDDSISKTGGQSADQYGAMQGAVGAFDDQLLQNKQFVRSAYDTARNASGNDAKLGGAEFVADANKALSDNFATMSLPGDVKAILKSIEKKPDQFTLGKSEEIIKRLNKAHSASLKIDGTGSSETYAIGLVRDALNGRQTVALQNLANNGNEAAGLYQFARQAHGFNANHVESMPLLKDVVKGVEPDKLFNKHILGGNVAEIDKSIKMLKNINPQAVNDIKQQVLEHISSKAININGQFSPAGMKRVLDSIGNRRLATMFTPDEIARIQDIGRAGHYLVTQPAHSNINNSNTASVLLNHLSGLINKPGVRMLLAPVKDVKDSMQVGKAMNSSMPGNTAPTDVNLTLLEKLTQAGILSGSNLSDQ